MLPGIKRRSFQDICIGQGIDLTRSRPYQKNDQAWVEQKNGSVVRRLVGYRRLEGPAAAAILARLYAASRLFVNFFQPSFKLKTRRVGGRTIKRHDPPQTPCARLLAAISTPEAVKIRLAEILASLDPLRLLEEIRQAQHQLATLAEHGPAALPATQNADLQRFLMGLSTAWHAGEVRPTHRERKREPRAWRTRKDPFEATWSTVFNWFAENPEHTAKESFSRLQAQRPGQKSPTISYVPCNDVCGNGECNEHDTSSSGFTMVRQRLTSQLSPTPWSRSSTRLAQSCLPGKDAVGRPKAMAAVSTPNLCRLRRQTALRLCRSLKRQELEIWR